MLYKRRMSSYSIFVNLTLLDLQDLILEVWISIPKYANNKQTFWPKITDIITIHMYIKQLERSNEAIQSVIWIEMQ